MKKRTQMVVQRAKPAKNGGLFHGVSPAANVFSIKDFATRYQLSHDTLTRMTGFSLRAVSNWAQGARPSVSTARRLTETKRLFSALERLVPPEVVGLWLKEPNPAFDGSTPLQVIERGETDRIWRMVHELESGEPA